MRTLGALLLFYLGRVVLALDVHAQIGEARYRPERTIYTYHICLLVAAFSTLMACDLQSLRAS